MTSIQSYCTDGKLIDELHAYARSRRLAVEIRMGVFTSHSVRSGGVTMVVHDMSFADMGVL